MKVFVDNPFPVVLLKHQNSVRCLDLSARWVGRGGGRGSGCIDIHTFALSSQFGNLHVFDMHVTCTGI